MAASNPQLGGQADPIDCTEGRCECHRPAHLPRMGSSLDTVCQPCSSLYAGIRCSGAIPHEKRRRAAILPPKSVSHINACQHTESNCAGEHMSRFSILQQDTDQSYAWLACRFARRSNGFSTLGLGRVHQHLWPQWRIRASPCRSAGCERLCSHQFQLTWK